MIAWHWYTERYRYDVEIRRLCIRFIIRPLGSLYLYSWPLYLFIFIVRPLGSCPPCLRSQLLCHRRIWPQGAINFEQYWKDKTLHMIKSNKSMIMIIRTVWQWAWRGWVGCAQNNITASLVTDRNHYCDKCDDNDDGDDHFICIWL